VRIAPSGGIRWSRLLLSLGGDTLRQTWTSVTGAARIIGGMPRIAPGDLSLLKEWIEMGHLRTVIDRSYPLDHIAEAFRYAEAGHKKGHVVITLVV
jgi:NADPH:quinone reductase-like Zn-dependent oxidoreductase